MDGSKAVQSVKNKHKYIYKKEKPFIIIEKMHMPIVHDMNVALKSCYQPKIHFEQLFPNR